MLPLLMQHPMHEGDGDRSFADGRRDPFDVSGAHVADREDSRPAGFEKMRLPGKRPAGGCQILRSKVRTGLDETAAVECDASVEPLRGGNGARDHEQMTDVLRRL